ncbi:acyltransferase family protein [Ramlibacter montanisoli]|uniref:Acyltransferase n=1 Tax=Ramlibacter montanisoli TaxID=2732512 RepID=A0A849KF77_9BURK|nr:acyltransferase [Ramlibacter montanisoli]NNU42853.1 acyltransferase [Ramlibacter montanisoli]
MLGWKFWLNICSYDPARGEQTLDPNPQLGHSAVGHRPDIDGLRALAVLPIVLFHLGVPGFGGGYVGVDIFFVISGFLITQRLLSDSHLLRFYERRARRILPALMVVLAATTAAASVLLMPLDLAAYGRSMIATLVFASNFHFWSEVGYFDEPAALKPLLHTWSLGVEEQFYILFPLFLMFAIKARRSLVVVGMAATLSFIADAWFVTRSPALAFYWCPFRAWELMLGACLAMARLPAARSWEAAAGFLLIGIAVFGYSEATPFPGFAALLPCAGAALLLHAGGMQAASPLRWGAAVFIGRISFSLYLWHWPVIVFYRYLWGEPDAASIFLLAGLTVALSTLTYIFVEEPVRTRRRVSSIARFSVVAGALGVLVGAVTLGDCPVVSRRKSLPLKQRRWTWTLTCSIATTGLPRKPQPGNFASSER